MPPRTASFRSAGELELLAAPARELHGGRRLLQPIERKAERVVGGQRSERVLGLMARAEREPDPAPLERHMRAVLAELDVHLPHSAHVDVVALEVGLELSRAWH